MSPLLRFARAALVAAVVAAGLAFSCPSKGPASARTVQIHVDSASGEQDITLTADGQGLGHGIRTADEPRAQPVARATAKPLANVGRISSVPLATTARADRRVLVILATWTSPDAVTQAQAEAQFADDDNWFSEVSYGTMGIAAAVTPWLHISGPDAGLCLTNSGQTLLQSQAAALAAGYDPMAYDSTIIYFPRQAGECAAIAGFAYQAGTVVFLNGTLDRRTTVHELGHNLDLMHAHAADCWSGEVRLPIADTGCKLHEYGDFSDAMGSDPSSPGYSAYARERAGWLTPERIADLTSGGSALILPLSSTTGTVATKIKDGDRTFWLEQREQAGVDAGLPSSAVGGLQVRVEDTALSAHGLTLLDATPLDGWDTWLLPRGGSWQLPSGATIQVSRQIKSGLSVTVTPA